MAASRMDIKGWFDRGRREGATHMIVVCDTFDWEDYPVMIPPDRDVRKMYDLFNGKNMQKVIEVYNLSMDSDAQMSEYRAFHF